MRNEQDLIKKLQAEAKGIEGHEDCVTSPVLLSYSDMRTIVKALKLMRDLKMAVR